MTVYIDSSRHRLGRMIMCHMAADTLVELHAMADILGVRRWFQDKPGAPHYDICKATRARALRLGAIEVSSRALLKAARRAAAIPNEAMGDTGPVSLVTRKETQC